MRTATRVFATFVLADEAHPVKAEGSAVVTIPERSMHSFVAPHNKVIWAFRLQEDIASWPDTMEELQVTVTPRRR